MNSYDAPIKDVLYNLYEVLKIDKLGIYDQEIVSRDMTTAIFDEANKLASQTLFPLNLIGDIEGCNLKNGLVSTPKGFKEAFKIICEGGWPSLNCDKEFGGQGIPLSISTSIGEFFGSANVAFYIYCVLTHGAYSTILAHGSKEQKQTYLPKLVSCEWTGTMNLTEAQCGTDLRLIKTKAIEKNDGSYEISGEKIYISAGDHDLSKNIIHLVLARIPGEPDGIKGLSLFIVPKLLKSKDGTYSKKNNISVGKLENKMGIHGNATCLLNYDQAKGFLLGEKNNGLKSMFTMMNEARLAVGIQGLSQAEIAYQQAISFAKDRLQGSSIEGIKKKKKDAEPIIVHPDVKRILLEQKTFIEGARALALWTSILMDKEKLNNDQESGGLANLLIPVVKGYITDKGFDTTISCQQIFGGQGYVEDSGMSQYCRDSRIAMIYEGTNAIQAIDLISRKLPKNGGKDMLFLFSIIDNFLNEINQLDNFDKSLMISFKSSYDDLKKALNFLVENGFKNPEAVLSGATDFMHLFGNFLIGFMWIKMALTSFKFEIKNNDSDSFHKGKLLKAKFYMQKSAPETKFKLQKLLSGEKTLMSLDVECL